MRDSYFAPTVQAVLIALDESSGYQPQNVDALLRDIQSKLADQLEDERSPERDWRRGTARSLMCLADLLRGLGRPAPSVEVLVHDMLH